MPINWDSQATQVSTLNNIVLSGIFNDGNQNSAVINGTTVHEREFIQGYEIVKINKNSVTLKNNRGVFVILLDAKVVTPTVNKEGSSSK